MGFPNGRRRLVLAAAVLLVTVAVAVTVYRVLAPAEVSTPARGTYPTSPSRAPGVVARLPVAPLVVDGRLRVYAAQRQVYADRPVDHRYRTTPYWSYRRWPAELAGVVASGTTVVTRWSDGLLVALDARTGRVAWRAEGPPAAGKPTARRTGAATLWNPEGLLVTPTAGGESVVVVAGGASLAAVDLADGRLRWSAGVGAGCHDTVGTTTAGRLVSVDACDGAATVEFRDAATGTVGTRWRPPGAGDALAATPLGCRTGRSGCAGLRTVVGSGDGAGRGWLLGGGEPTAAPALDQPDSVLGGDTAVGTAGGALVGRDARTGAERWRRDDLGAARVLAVEPDRVHLVTDDNDLVTLDPATGAQRSWFTLTAGSDGTAWAPGAAYAVDGYVAIERLREPVDPEADDQRYFFTSEPVLLAAT